MRLLNNFSRILLPPSQAAAQRKDDIGMPTGRRNYHRRSIFELGPKGNWFLFSAIPTSHFMLWMPDTSRMIRLVSYQPVLKKDSKCLKKWIRIENITIESAAVIIALTDPIHSLVQERFQRFQNWETKRNARNYISWSFQGQVRERFISFSLNLSFYVSEQ